MSEIASVAMTTVLCILGIVDIAGNSLVCLIIKKNRDMRIPINYLLANLAVADILYAAFITPKIFFKLHFFHPDGLSGTMFCKFLTHGNFAWVGAASSIITLVAIATERYFAVMYPLGNKGKLTKGKLKVVISGVWISSFIFNTPLFLVDKFEKKRNKCIAAWPEDWMNKAYTLIWVVLVVFTCVLMVGFYSRVGYTLWFTRNDAHQLNYQQSCVMRLRKRVTLMVVTVSVIFGICWGTSSVVYIFKNVTSYHIGPVPVTIINTMVLFNSAINPFVYALLNQRYRRMLKRMMCCSHGLQPRVRPTKEPQKIELADKNVSHPTPQKDQAGGGRRALTSLTHPCSPKNKVEKQRFM